MAIVTDTLNGFGLNRVDVRDVLFLTGAGISAPDPTRFFLGAALHKMVLENFTNLTPTEINAVVGKVPFEKSCECIENVFKTHRLSAFVQVFWNLMSEMFLWRRENHWKQPNELHAFFREHIRQGGCHITANLDQFIETDMLYHAIRTTYMFDDGIPLRNGEGILYKFHGDFERDFAGGQGFVYSAIANGFSDTVKGYWDTLLDRVKVVVVCGYSGSDIFDVIPYFRLKATAHFRSSIIWVKHGTGTLSRLTGVVSPDIDMILSKFTAMAVLSGKAGDVLNDVLPTLPRVNIMTSTGPVCADYTETFTRTVDDYSTQYADFADFKQRAGAQISAVLATIP